MNLFNFRHVALLCGTVMAFGLTGCPGTSKDDTAAEGEGEGEGEGEEIGRAHV